MKHLDTWRRASITAVLVVASLAGVRMAGSVEILPDGVYRFVRYYQALGETGVPVSLWERVVFSLSLLSTPAAPREKTSATTTAS